MIALRLALGLIVAVRRYGPAPLYWRARYVRAGTGPAWWDVHRAYLASATWRRLRATCLRSNAGRCRRNRWHRATTAHHTTYKRAGREHLHDLTPLCTECHEHAHGGRRMFGRRRRTL